MREYCYFSTEMSSKDSQMDQFPNQGYLKWMKDPSNM